MSEVAQRVDRQVLDEVVQPRHLAQALRQVALGDDRVHVGIADAMMMSKASECVHLRFRSA